MKRQPNFSALAPFWPFGHKEGVEFVTQIAFELKARLTKCYCSNEQEHYMNLHVIRNHSFTCYSTEAALLSFRVPLRLASLVGSLYEQLP